MQYMKQLHRSVGCIPPLTDKSQREGLLGLISPYHRFGDAVASPKPPLPSLGKGGKGQMSRAMPKGLP